MKTSYWFWATRPLGSKVDCLWSTREQPLASQSAVSGKSVSRRERLLRRMGFIAGEKYGGLKKEVGFKDNGLLLGRLEATAGK